VSCADDLECLIQLDKEALQSTLHSFEKPVGSQRKTALPDNLLGTCGGKSVAT
jgi:hypothetical protein